MKTVLRTWIALCLALPVSALAATASPPQFGSPPGSDNDHDMSPDFITPQEGAIYPIAFNNVQGMVSTLYLTTLTPQGSYEVCQNIDTNGVRSQCVSIVAPHGVASFTMDQLGIPAGATTLISVATADTATQGFSTLMMRDAAGGSTFIQGRECGLCQHRGS